MSSIYVWVVRTHTHTHTHTHTSDFIKGMRCTYQWAKEPVVKVVSSPYRRPETKSWKSSVQGSREGRSHCLVLGQDNI